MNEECGKESQTDEVTTPNNTAKIEPASADQAATSATVVKDQVDHASGDATQGQGPACLEDMMRMLHKQIKSSDWLQQNTAEKWVAENPQLAKDYMEAAKKS